MSLASEVVADLEKRFHFTPTTTETEAAHSGVEAIVLDAAKAVLELTPVGRESSLVLTKLEEAAQWAHTAISRAEGVVTADTAEVVPEPAPVAPEPVPETSEAMPPVEAPVA